MSFIKNILFNYWWTKGEKAYRKGNTETSDKYANKIYKYIF